MLKHVFASLLITSLLTLGLACQAEKTTTSATTAPPTAATAAAPLTITDDLGRVVTLATAPRRIVSLAPSNTENLFALGLGDRIVGADDFSDYPEAAKAIPKVGGFQPSVEKILSLEPNLVVTVKGSPDLLKQLENAGVAVAVFDPQGINGVLEDIRLLGQITGAEAKGKAVADELKAKLDAVQNKTKGAAKPRVFYEVDATDPARPYTAGSGSFVDALISLAGGQNVAADAATMWPQLSAEAIVAKDPEIVLLSDAAFGVTPQQVASRTGWANITAVKKGAIYPVDPNLTTRPGPRLAEGLLAIAKILHPELFP